MHSRIFGIDLAEHVVEGTQLYLDDIDLPFADYTDRGTNLDADVEWLLGYLGNAQDYITYNPRTRELIFENGFKEAYFEKRYQALERLVNSEHGFEQFCRDSYSFSRLINSKYEFYVADSDSCWETLDEFIRGAMPKTAYVIFDSCDYHW